MRNYESDAYRKYRSSMEQRQKVVRTSGSPYSQQTAVQLSLIHISEPTRPLSQSRMPSSA